MNSRNLTNIQCGMHNAQFIMHNLDTPVEWKWWKHGISGLT